MKTLILLSLVISLLSFSKSDKSAECDVLHVYALHVLASDGRLHVVFPSLSVEVFTDDTAWTMVKERPSKPGIYAEGYYKSEDGIITHTMVRACEAIFYDGEAYHCFRRHGDEIVATQTTSPFMSLCYMKSPGAVAWEECRRLTGQCKSVLIIED